MTRSELGLAAALTALALVPLALVKHPPIQDYPYHLVRAHVLAHHDDPAFDYAETFTVSYYPAPYVLADWLTAGLGRFVGVAAAGKGVLALYLVLFPWGLLYLARSVGEDRTVLGFTGFLWVFNWHFHMGFVSYVLSLPPALFAMGWWWRSRRDLSWGRTAGLAALVLVTYLAHVYAFGVLGFVLVLLALVEGRRLGRPVGLPVRTLAAFAPALVLLGGAVARNVARSAGDQGPLLLLYGNLQRKVLLALGTLPSFSLPWETTLFALAVAAAGVLAVLGWRSGRRPSGPWLLAAAALGLLYLALPDHVGRVFFVSNRVPLFVLLVALVALPVPASPRLRAAGMTLFAALALCHVTVLAVRYRQIDRRLADYAAALEVLPADARVSFRADEESMAEGRIAPAALFGGYHYLEAPGRRIPDLEHFVGTLRVVDYRRDAGRSLSTASAGSREELEELLGRRWLVGMGGWLVVVGEDEGGRIARVAEDRGFHAVAAPGPVGLYRKVRPVFGDEEESAEYATGYEGCFDRLVVYRDPERGRSPASAGLEPLFSRGWAAVYGSDCEPAGGVGSLPPPRGP